MSPPPVLQTPLLPPSDQHPSASGPAPPARSLQMPAGAAIVSVASEHARVLHVAAPSGSFRSATPRPLFALPGRALLLRLLLR
eukprot:10304984-Alexandrium_andersonii.AAC.1